MNGHSTQYQEKCQTLSKKKFFPDSIPLETLAISGQHALNLKSNSRSNSYDQIDNYPTSPFGHSSSGSQKTFDYTANKSSNISVKFPKLKYVKVCLLSLLVIYTLVSIYCCYYSAKLINWLIVLINCRRFHLFLLKRKKKFGPM